MDVRNDSERVTHINQHSLSQRLNKQDVTQVLDGQPDTTLYLAAQNELNALGGTQKTEPIWDQNTRCPKKKFPLASLLGC